MHPAKWRVRKHMSVWSVYRPSAAWGTRKLDGWAGDFGTWGEAMAFATDVRERLAVLDAVSPNLDPGYRLMWAEGLTL